MTFVSFFFVVLLFFRVESIDLACVSTLPFGFVSQLRRGAHEGEVAPPFHRDGVNPSVEHVWLTKRKVSHAGQIGPLAVQITHFFHGSTSSICTSFDGADLEDVNGL